MNKSPSRYFNRELSWLKFNERVLEEAQDESIPLLERLKFLAISASNLDEFFMVRVGGLQILSEQDNAKIDPAGMTPKAQLQAISNRTHQMTSNQYTCFLDKLQPGLSAAGVRRIVPAELSQHQIDYLQRVFDDEIYSILTPMAVSLTEDIPFVFNQTLNICVQLKSDENDEENLPRFAIIPLGRSPRRFITLPSTDRGYEFILLEDLVDMFVERFFPGEPVMECVPFRITRNADLSLREDQASDLLIQMAAILDARRVSDCVRLEISDQASSELLRFLQATLDVKAPYTYAIPGPLDLSAFMSLAELNGFEGLKFKPWPSRQAPQLDPTRSMFDVISEQDVLLYHPYESFEPVQKLLIEAAEDPDVLAIKQILYRVSRDSPIVDALKRAAEQGKYVTVIVELKARFDEGRNIEQAKSLEQSGVQVIYGVKGLKTHSKICVIVRREPHGIQRYVHSGTGNYNEVTSRIYSDVSFMTCNDDLGRDATSFFNSITGYSQPQKFRKVEAAPVGLRESLLEMIHTETRRKRQGQHAAITAKINSLVDPEIIDALYEASQSGVPVKLNVRGICCLKPGVDGLSENISVVSIVDRFLEHSRILYFYHGGNERVFISSADWMPRNLDRRIELLVPIEAKACRDRLIDILELYFHDTVKGRKLLPDGHYEPIRPEPGHSSIRSQEVLYQQIGDALKQTEQTRRTIFETHRAINT